MLPACGSLSAKSLRSVSIAAIRWALVRNFLSAGGGGGLGTFAKVVAGLVASLFAEDTEWWCSARTADRCVPLWQPRCSVGTSWTRLKIC